LLPLHGCIHNKRDSLQEYNRWDPLPTLNKGDVCLVAIKS